MNTRMLRIVMAALTLMLLMGSYANAQNDKNNYDGDRLTFSVNVKAKFGNHSTCIPKGTELRGFPPTTDGSLNVRVEKLNKDAPACGGDTNVNATENIVLNIPKEEIDKTPPNRFGLCYGALVVPYKYHFTGSKDFNGNSSVGPYMGYRFDKESFGVSAEFVGFIGVSNISVTQSVNGQNTTQSLAGFSYGLGIIGNVKNSFQLGVVFGADRVSGSANYKDNGKIWGAIELGYSFAQ